MSGHILLECERDQGYGRGMFTWAISKEGNVKEQTQLRDCDRERESHEKAFSLATYYLHKELRF
jgi:hypothetical protein